MAFASGGIEFSHAADRTVTVQMSAGTSQQGVIALENALLRVGPANEGFMHAVYSGARLAGALELIFEFEDGAIVPTLPAPYASGDVIPLSFSGTVVALDTWTPQQPGATLRLFIAAAPSNEVFQTTLLDLSGDADQFGVQLIGIDSQQRAISTDGLALSVPQYRLRFTPYQASRGSPSSIKKLTTGWTLLQPTTDPRSLCGSRRSTLFASTRRWRFLHSPRRKRML
jgi:hypothetical protein